MALSTQTDFYLNLNQLSEMKLGARQNTADASRPVAQQFESLFIQQMLAAMRSAATIDENSHSSYTDFYQEMHDKQLALTMAKQGGLGLTKFIMQQLPGGQSDSGKGGETLPLHSFQEVAKTPTVRKMDYQPENPAVLVKPFIHDDIASASQTELKPPLQGSWNNAQAFIRDILPEAKTAANILGISPGLLVAQSALETGWGKHVMTRPDGSSAFNLFGIKAGSGWSGDTVSKPTLEFRNGVMQTEIAHFRAYASAGDSLKDYVNFIQSNARYSNALDHGGNDVDYVKSLQQAGYATDPEYADKILSIMKGNQLQLTLNGETSHA
jgi:flagellar protein FlgJ